MILLVAPTKAPPGHLHRTDLVVGCLLGLGPGVLLTAWGARENARLASGGEAARRRSSRMTSAATKFWPLGVVFVYWPRSSAAVVAVGVLAGISFTFAVWILFTRLPPLPPPPTSPDAPEGAPPGDGG